jgi:biotin carboxyl carrier protein
LRYEVEVDGHSRTVVVTRTGDGFAVTIDGRTWQVDAARVDAQIVSLLISDMWPIGDTGSASYEATISRDRQSASATVRIGSSVVVVRLNGRRRRRGAEDHTGAGPQRIVAPMPGKVVRVLVKPGEAVQARQPLVVVEAMKMENELRAGARGTVTEVPVVEGASVEAGALLVVLE